MRFYPCIVLSLIGAACAYYPDSLLEPPEQSPYGLSDLFLREVLEKGGKNLDGYNYDRQPYDEAMALDELAQSLAALEKAGGDNSPGVELRNWDGPSTSIRDQEYLQHSSLFGHQFVAGGAGEGAQRLSPSGAMKNLQEVKTDAVLPAYCDPPNPCPVGYTAEDGCIEEFENTAAFSREYQAAQDCMCDSEHMFSCQQQPQSKDTELNTLARSIQNEGLTHNNIDEILKDIKTDKKHYTVAKKFHNTRVQEDDNPYLQGDKLPVAAKKGGHIH